MSRFNDALRFLEKCDVDCRTGGCGILFHLLWP